MSDHDPHEFDNLIEQVHTNDALMAAVKRLSEWIPQDEAGGPDLVDDHVER